MLVVIIYQSMKMKYKSFKIFKSFLLLSSFSS